MQYTAIFAIIMSVVISALSISLSYRYVRRSYGAMDILLDKIQARDCELNALSSEDSRISKLTHKAWRIMQMYIADAQRSASEKQTVQELISDMSHQMKTPLAGILMYSSLLSEGSLSESEQREFLARIESGTQRLRWMMECLIKMSRLELGAIQLSPAMYGIKQTIADGIRSVLSYAEKKSISISVDESDDIPLFHDRKWTAEVFTNILENAVKYSPEGGEINISLEEMTLYTKVKITDHGIGIDPGEWNSIFKRFYRGGNTGGYEGAGLGLYIASLIMERQNGYIMVDSKRDEYTSFSVLLQNRKK